MTNIKVLLLAQMLRLIVASPFQLAALLALLDVKLQWLFQVRLHLIERRVLLS